MNVNGGDIVGIVSERKNIGRVLLLLYGSVDNNNIWGAECILFGNSHQSRNNNNTKRGGDTARILNK